MAEVYDPVRREWVYAQYDPVTNCYFDADSRNVGRREDKYNYGTAILQKRVTYDPISDAYYDTEDRFVAKGPVDD